jgi:hypothetical protein
LVVATRQQQRQLLAKAKGLKEFELFKHVHVRPSLTAEERQSRAAAVQECVKKRKDTGLDFIVYGGVVVERSKITEEWKKSIAA